MASPRYSQPCINVAVKQLSRQTVRSFAKAKQSKEANNIRRCNKLKKKYNDACKRVTASCITNIISPDSTSSPNSFWSFIKSKKNQIWSRTTRSKDRHDTFRQYNQANIQNEQFSAFNKTDGANTIPDMEPSPHSINEPH